MSLQTKWRACEQTEVLTAVYFQMEKKREKNKEEEGAEKGKEEKDGFANE